MDRRRIPFCPGASSLDPALNSLQIRRQIHACRMRNRDSDDKWRAVFRASGEAESPFGHSVSSSLLEAGRRCYYELGGTYARAPMPCIHIAIALKILRDLGASIW